MTLNEKSIKKGKKGRPKEWNGVYEVPNVIEEIYGEKFGITELTEDNIDELVSLYERSQPNVQKMVNHWVFMELRTLERKEMTEDDKKWQKLLFEFVSKKNNMYAKREPTRKDSIWYPEDTEELIDEHYKTSGKAPSYMKPMSKDEKEEFGRTKYKDQQIVLKFFDALSIRDTAEVKRLFDERGLSKYLTLKDKKDMKVVVNESAKEKFNAEKEKRKQRPITFRMFLTIKEKYLADGHTEKEWNDLWK